MDRAVQRGATMRAGGIRERSRVAILDDDPALVDVLATILRFEGHDVDGFTDPAEALASICDAAPDVLLLDYHLPDATAHDFIEALRDAGVEIPIVLVTSARQKAIASVSSAVRAVVHKPVDMEHLLRVVARALTTRRPVAACAVLPPAA
jgi:two-component system, OmpR family, response regulator